MSNEMYIERWNHQLRIPVPGSPILSVDEAAARYDRKEPFVVVDGTRGDDGSHQPQWVMGWAHTGARMSFLNLHGSVWRLIDYDARDGRLWRWKTVDYTYASDDRYYAVNACTQKITSKFDPDGTGYIDFDDKSKEVVDRARFESAPIVANFWMDWPEFGQWNGLTDPDYGFDMSQ